MVFVLQQTSLSGFNLQTSHMAENASLSEENNKIVKPKCNLIKTEFLEYLSLLNNDEMLTFI